MSFVCRHPPRTPNLNNKALDPKHKVKSKLRTFHRLPFEVPYADRHRRGLGRKQPQFRVQGLGFRGNLGIRVTLNRISLSACLLFFFFSPLEGVSRRKPRSPDSGSTHGVP